MSRIPATARKPRLFITTNVVGLGIEDNFEFLHDRPYRFCCICGRVFQSVHDRVSAKRYDGAHIVDGAFERELWALKHARLHPQWQHDDFKRSGLFVTPAAAERLVPFGIIPVQDIVESVESAHAGLLAPRAPIDDAETSLKVLR